MKASVANRIEVDGQIISVSEAANQRSRLSNLLVPVQRDLREIFARSYSDSVHLSDPMEDTHPVVPQVRHRRILEAQDFEERKSTFKMVLNTPATSFERVLSPCSCRGSVLSRAECKTTPCTPAAR